MMRLIWIWFVLLHAAMGQNANELQQCYNRTVICHNYTSALDYCSDTIVDFFSQSSTPNMTSHRYRLQLHYVDISQDIVTRITNPVADDECWCEEEQPCVLSAFNNGDNCTSTQSSDITTIECQGDVEPIITEGTAILLYTRFGCDTLLTQNQVLVIVRAGDADTTDDCTESDSCTTTTNGTSECMDSFLSIECDCPSTIQMCIDICLNTTSSECQEDLDDFCDDLIEDLLAPERFSGDDVASVVDIIAARQTITSLNSTLDNMLDLFAYFDAFPEDSVAYLEDDSETVEVLRILDILFDDEIINDWEDLEGAGATSSLLLLEMEELAVLIGRTTNLLFRFIGANMIMMVESPTSLNVVDGFFTFPSNNTVFAGVNNTLVEHAQLQIPLKAVCSGSESTEGCVSVVSSFLMRNLPNYLDPLRERIPASYLLSAQVRFADNFPELLLNNPATLSFSPLETETTDYTCFFWNFTIGDWSSSNVMTTQPNEDNSNVLCTTTHLTSFAVLVSLNGPEFVSAEEALALSVVTYVGCSISIVCLALTIFCLIAFRKLLNKGPLLYIHLNLAVALFIGLVVFVAGIEAATEVEWLCTVVAALLHYLFLCVFCWMLAEGIMLYLLVVRVFGTAAEKWYYLMILGWGVPLPIAAISAGVLYEDYGNDDYCWINADAEEPAIWLFVGPMLIIMVINSVILVMTVVSMVRGRKQGGAETGVSTLQLVKTAIKGTVILLPLLGITWIIGIFAVNENTTVFAWLFTIFNSLQGVLIFILHVLRNEHLLGKLKRRIYYTGGKEKKSSAAVASAEMGQKSLVSSIGDKA